MTDQPNRSASGGRISMFSRPDDPIYLITQSGRVIRFDTMRDMLRRDLERRRRRAAIIRGLSPAYRRRHVRNRRRRSS